MSNSSSSKNVSRSTDKTPSAEQLSDTVYGELRKLAYAKMSKENAVLTLQPTALVHEAWIRLGGEDQPEWANKAHFYSAAAEAMRRILIERARKRQAVRHGGGKQRVEIDQVEGLSGEIKDDKQMIDLSDALDKLSKKDPRKAELVKLRYFIGLTFDEAAKTLDVSNPTVRRWWTYSRSWLYREMNRG